MHKSLLTWMPAVFLAGLVALCSGYRATLPARESVSAEVSYDNTAAGFPENYSELLGSNDIIIKNTSFTPAGFVIVREEVAGNPSEIIGESELVDNESSEFIVLSLSKSIKKDDVIYINYFIDNGDGRFDPELDQQKTSLLGDSSYIKLIVVNNKVDNPQELKL